MLCEVQSTPTEPSAAKRRMRVRVSRADEGSSRDAAASSDGAGVPGWVWPVGVLLVVVALALVAAGRLRGRRAPAAVPGDATSSGTDEQGSGTRGSRRVAAHDTTKEV